MRYELTILTEVGQDKYPIEREVIGRGGVIFYRELKRDKALAYSIMGKERADYLYLEIELKHGYRDLMEWLNTTPLVLRYLLIKQQPRGNI